jgi:hypothetical protein
VYAILFHANDCGRVDWTQAEPVTAQADGARERGQAQIFGNRSAVLFGRVGGHLKKRGKIEPVSGP